jgi:hypothetical protein
MSGKWLNALYWILILSVAGALFVEIYALAAFLALLSVTIQLSEIATYLGCILVIQQGRSKDVTRTGI